MFMGVFVSFFLHEACAVIAYLGGESFTSREALPAGDGDVCAVTNPDVTKLRKATAEL